MRFYLGTHMASWLTDERFRGVPLFISHRRLRMRKTPFRPSLAPYVVDSGAFTEISTYGRWETTPQEYATALKRYWRELGPFDWAAQQDSMCEPFVLDKVAEVTGRRPTVEDHQRLTVENYLQLRELTQGLPVAPTLQGWELTDYLRHVEMFSAAGVDLSALPVVGVGSVCRREATKEIGELMHHLSDLGLRVHGFGVKLGGLRHAGHRLSSADSMAWSFWGRRKPAASCSHPAKNCANCADFALGWRTKVLSLDFSAESATSR